MRNKLPKIKSLLDKAESELSEFTRTRRFANESQACEKTWVAFTLLCEYKSGKEIRNFATTKKIAKELGLELLFRLCYNLHIIHYEGSPAITDESVIEDVGEAINSIRIILKTFAKTI